MLIDIIFQGISSCRVLLCCLSPKSLVSDYCTKEILLADLLKKPILPVMMAKTPWPPPGPLAMILAPLVYTDLAGAGGHGGQVCQDCNEVDKCVKPVWQWSWSGCCMPTFRENTPTGCRRWLPYCSNWSLLLWQSGGRRTRWTSEKECENCAKCCEINLNCIPARGAKGEHFKICGCAIQCIYDKSIVQSSVFTACQLCRRTRQSSKSVWRLLQLGWVQFLS